MHCCKGGEQHSNTASTHMEHYSAVVVSITMIVVILSDFDAIRLVLVTIDHSQVLLTMYSGPWASK